MHRIVHLYTTRVHVWAMHQLPVELINQEKQLFTHKNIMKYLDKST